MFKLLNILFLFCLLITSSISYADITVALVAPKAGNYVQQGTELYKGVEQAITQINNEGGLLGEKINLLSIDDQCNDSIAISTAQLLSISKENKISLVIGPYCANSFEEVADIYSKAKIFQIIPTTVNYSQAKTIKKGLVKMLGYTSQQATDFFEYYNMSEFAGETVAVIYNQKDIENTEEVNSIIKEFKKHGKSIVLKEYSYNEYDNDIDNLAQNITGSNIKIAFIIGSSAEIKKTAYKLKDLNKDFVIFTNKYAATNEYFEYLGDKANGTYFLELKGSDTDPEFAETLVNLRLSGLDTEGLSLYGYSSIKLWEELVKKSKSFDYSKLSANINDTQIKTTIGKKFFHNGVPAKSESYAILFYENGHFQKKN